MLNNSSDYDIPCFFNINGNTCNVSLLNMLFDLDLFYMDYLVLRKLPFVVVCTGQLN